MSHYEVIIIGAGFAGASTAWWLKQAGIERILVLEKESFPGARASGKNAAIARQATDEHETSMLASRSISFIRNPPSSFSESPLYSVCGGYLLSPIPEDPRLELLRHNALAAGVFTFPASRLEVLQRVPFLQDSPFKYALACPSDGIMDIHALLTAYLRPVEVLCDTEVSALQTSPRKVREVVTSKGTFTADWIVNAAGSYAQQIGNLAGAQRFPLTPKRRHLVHTGPVSWADPRWPYVWNVDPEVYFRPESGGILLSPCDAEPQPPEVPQVNPDAPIWLALRLGAVFPALTSLPVARMWAELRCFTQDNLFVIGRDPHLVNFLWVCGLGGHGVTTSAAVGELAASLLTGTAPFIDPEPFAPKRFAEKE